MKRGLWPVLFTGILLILFAGCGGPAVQPLVFNPRRGMTGEVNTYDLKDRNGAPIGTASWTWQEDPDHGQWTQGYELDINGRIDRGEVVMGETSAPSAPGARWAAAFCSDLCSRRDYYFDHGG